MKKLYRRIVLAFVGLFLGAGSVALAQEITLRSADGSVELGGKLLEFDGEFYRIDSQFGELTLRALGLICSGLGCPDPGQYAADLTVSGTRQVVDGLLPGLIEDFGFSTGLSTLREDGASGGWTYFISDSARVPVARLQSRGGESADALADLIAGRSDLAITSRPAGKGEINAAKTAGIGDLASPFRRQVLALDGLVILVSKENPVVALTLEEIARIYSGDISNWAEVGGFDAPISLIQRPADSDIGRYFTQQIFRPEDGYSPLPAPGFPTDAALSDAVAADPFAIGYGGISAIRNAKSVAIKGDCGVVQFISEFGLQSGDYPLVRPIYLFTPKRRLPVFARDFLAWLDTTQAQNAIAGLGFVSQGVTRQTLADQKGRVANALTQADKEISLETLRGFVEMFKGAQRLSSSFRFNDGTTIMDPRSRRNIETLARMIEVGDFDGREVIFAGFSDSQGRAAGNRRLSRQRAEQISKQIREAANRADLSKIRFRAVGLGEVSPLACNGDATGRHTNRRVEVWVR
jgi:phosphate transport system substrate-binding protein